MFYVMVALGVALIVLVLMFLRSKQRDGDSPPRLVSVPPARASGSPSTPPSSVKENWLVGESGAVQGKTYHLGSRTVILGRGTTCFVQIDDENCSRQHAQIRPTPDGLLLTDMRSANGTFVNGKRVKTQLLHEGDRIRIEENVLIFHRQGDFDRDEGLGRKSAGKTSSAETAYADSPKFGFIAVDILKKFDGDVKKAAEAMDMSEEEFKVLIKEHHQENQN